MGKNAAAETKLFDTEERPMTNEDRIQIGEQLADIDEQINAIEDEKRSVNASYSSRIKKLKTQARKLSRQWKDGVIEVTFEIVEVHDDKRLMVDIERKDNGRKISTRQMTEPEKEAARKRLQVAIPGTDEDPIVDDDYPNAKPAKKGKAKR